MDNSYALTVGQVTRYLKELLAIDDILNDLWLRGEVSGFTRHTSGHLYFTLKDADSQMRCVMWRTDAARLRFPVEQGVQVVAFGNVGIYEKTGVYQLQVREMRPDGLGALHMAYERLKERLAHEGLFDEDRKRPLPYLPRRVALITSPVGAALQDMLRILHDRNPRVDILLVPALVQGDLAPDSIEQALEVAARAEGVELIILARGGGSLEDLWAFNDEKVARAIYRCPLPVVSAVGHETDTTIADFVADCRCPTPSAAAQTVVPDWQELREHVAELWERATYQARRRIEAERSRLSRALERSVFEDPAELTRRRRQDIEALSARLAERSKLKVEGSRQKLSSLVAKMDALNPLSVLARGYGIFVRSGNGRRPVNSIEQVSVGEAGDLMLNDGSLHCEVVGKEPRVWNPQQKL
ncbi:MAG TPA: exodeoxyribonuclease VII large subunit [Armatimonadota bacterium]